MNLKNRLYHKELIVGTWLQSGSPVLAEIMADAGFYFIAADMEHTDINEAVFTQFARAVSGKALPMARVRENDVLAIRRVLDCGAAGVIVPLINNRAEAEKAVAAAKYPPQGERGFAFVRANHWGENFAEYAEKANDEVVVIVMIESKEAVLNIEEILSVDGVDGVLIGPYDLSGSYGIAGQTEHEIIQNAKKSVLDACKKSGKIAGQHIVLPTEQGVARAVAEGYKFLALGMDTVFLSSEAKRMMEMIS